MWILTLLIVLVEGHIEDSFNKVKTELDLLDHRLGFSNKNNTLDEYCSEVSKMKVGFDELIQKFKEEKL
jgi:hypothetical protein